MKQENLLTTLLIEGDSLMNISESASLRQMQPQFTNKLEAWYRERNAGTALRTCHSTREEP